MRFSFLPVVAVVLLSTVEISIGQVGAKGLSNRNPSHELVLKPVHHVKRADCKVNKRAKKAASKSTTSSRKKSTATVRIAAKATTSSKKTTSTTRKSTSTTRKTTSATNKTSSKGASTAASARASTSKTSVASTSTASSSVLSAGEAPPNSPWGSCFDLTATAFQPNWKGEATTTWCGVNFDITSPIIALPIADLSKAYGSNTAVTYYSNETLWRQMIGDWCGREVTLQGPSGQVKAYFGDANTWSSVDLNMNVFTKLKGVPTGTYADPDAARWMNNIKGCFSGNQISIKNGYPFAY